MFAVPSVLANMTRFLFGKSGWLFYLSDKRRWVYIISFGGPTRELFDEFNNQDTWL